VLHVLCLLADATLHCTAPTCLQSDELEAVAVDLQQQRAAACGWSDEDMAAFHRGIYAYRRNFGKVSKRLSNCHILQLHKQYYGVRHVMLLHATAHG
jgi:hypothetical protein